MNQHFKKRKTRTAASPAVVRRMSCTPVALSPPPSVVFDDNRSTHAVPNNNAGVMTTTPVPSSPTAAAATIEGANLADALTALKVSLKRDLDSFAPPTPAVSPMNARGGAKRARFDFAFVDDAEPSVDVPAMKVSPTTKARGALLAVSNHIKFEVEKRTRKTSERRQQFPVKRKQLSMLAIIGAFHRAARERDVPVKIHSLDRSMEVSTDRSITIDGSS